MQVICNLLLREIRIDAQLFHAGKMHLHHLLQMLLFCGILKVNMLSFSSFSTDREGLMDQETMDLLFDAWIETQAYDRLSGLFLSICKRAYEEGLRQGARLAAGQTEAAARPGAQR